MNFCHMPWHVCVCVSIDKIIVIPWSKLFSAFCFIFQTVYNHLISFLLTTLSALESKSLIKLCGDYTESKWKNFHFSSINNWLEFHWIWFCGSPKLSIKLNECFLCGSHTIWPILPISIKQSNDIFGQRISTKNF